MAETITLELHEATDEQLRHALSEAEDFGRRCDEQGSRGLHTWHRRAEHIRSALRARSRAASRQQEATE